LTSATMFAPPISAAKKIELMLYTLVDFSLKTDYASSRICKVGAKR
jgi:hypothetical protein